MRTVKPKIAISETDLFDPGRAVAVCVGVEDYAHLPRVYGAAANASRIFDAVTKSETAICGSEKSRLLLNPTYGEFHRFLESYTYQLSEGDHLFVYFCGRAEFVNGKSVLCLRDSSYLPSGVINPFTVQGWQAFFQLAGVVCARSVLFVWDACGNVKSMPNGKAFQKSLITGRDQGVPMPPAIPWAMSAFFSPYGKGESETRGSPTAAKSIHDFLVRPPKHAASDRFIPFRLFRKTAGHGENSPQGLRWFHEVNGDRIPVTKNPKAKVRTERFHPHYIEMLRVFESLPGAHDPQIVLAEVSPAAWTSVNKLSYAPWSLIEDGTEKGLKQLTTRGRAFLRNRLKIPLHIVNSGSEWEALGTEQVSVRFFEDRKRREQMLREAARQLELFP